MNSTKRNPLIRLEVESVVLGYDHITSYMNLKQRVVKANRKLADKLAAEVGIRIEGTGGGAGSREKIDVYLWLGDSSHSVVQSGISYLYRQYGI